MNEIVIMKSFDWFTCRERQESLLLHKLSLGIQKVSWVEAVWSLPLIFVKHHRWQHGHDNGSLGNKISSFDRRTLGKMILFNLLNVKRSLYLWNEITPNDCIFDSHSQSVQWDSVSKPLDLMKDGISVVKFLPVHQGGLAILPKNAVNLRLTFFLQE